MKKGFAATVRALALALWFSSEEGVYRKEEVREVIKALDEIVEAKE